MNLWECHHAGCKSTAVGSGGAIGLRAVGWHFEMGGLLMCPAHRPDKAPCTDLRGANLGAPCSLCPAEEEANRMQVLITHVLAGEDLSTGLLHVAQGDKTLCGKPWAPFALPMGDDGVPIADWTRATCQLCKLNVTAPALYESLQGGRQ